MAAVHEGRRHSAGSSLSHRLVLGFGNLTHQLRPVFLVHLDLVGRDVETALGAVVAIVVDVLV